MFCNEICLNKKKHIIIISFALFILYFLYLHYKYFIYLHYLFYNLYYLLLYYLIIIISIHALNLTITFELYIAVRLTLIFCAI